MEVRGRVLLFLMALRTELLEPNRPNRVPKYTEDWVNEILAFALNEERSIIWEIYEYMMSIL